VRSATLHMRAAIGPERGGDELAMRLDGPFALARARTLPTMRIVYARSAGAATTAATLVSTPDRAWVLAPDGRAVALPEASLRILRGKGGGGGRTLGSLHVDRWVRDAKLADGAGGTQRITGRLDVEALLRDLRAAGARIPELDGPNASRLNAALRSSTVTVVTGRDDRMLRSLDAGAVLDVPPALRARVRGAAVRISFHLGLERVNRPVRVRPPSG
jgi:hypothetical protein